MAGETTKITTTVTNPQPPAVLHDFFGGKAPTFPPLSLLNSEKQVGGQLERISCYGPKSDRSVSEISNQHQFVGSKRSHSDTAFTGSSSEVIPQMIPESSSVMKMLRSASGGDRFRISPFDGPLHGIPHQIRPVSSFLSQPTIGANAGFLNSERSVPMNVGGSNMQYNASVMKNSSPFSYQVSSSRLRDSSSGPSVLSQLAADEGSRTGNKGSGILNSLNAGSNPVSERIPCRVVPSGSNLKPLAHTLEPEPSNHPSSHGLTSGSRQMTIIYGGQVHVFDDVHPNKADVIMGLAGSNGGSWSTNLPKTSTRTTTNDFCLVGAENDTNTAGDRFFAQKYHNMLSAGANPIHGLGSINQGGNIGKAAGTSGRATEPRLEAKWEV